MLEWNYFTFNSEQFLYFAVKIVIFFQKDNVFGKIQYCFFAKKHLINFLSTKNFAFISIKIDINLQGDIKDWNFHILWMCINWTVLQLNIYYWKDIFTKTRIRKQGLLQIKNCLCIQLGHMWYHMVGNVIWVQVRTVLRIRWMKFPTL